MITKLERFSKIAAFVLIKINVIAMLCCIILFVLGLWTISSSNTLSYVIQSFGGKTINALLPLRVLTIQLGVSLAFISGLIFFISAMGFYGAVTKSQFLLFMYSTLIFLMCLLECALTYYFASNLVEKGLLEEDGQWTHALRITFKCCDFNGSKSIDPRPPWSCCGVETYPQNCTITAAYPKDCQPTIAKWLEHNQSLIYASLIVLHVVLISCSILRRSRSASFSGR